MTDRPTADAQTQTPEDAPAVESAQRAEGAGADGAEEAEVEVTAAVVTDGAYALIVADFSDVDSAKEAYEELEEATKASRLDIEGVLVLKKSEAGELTVQKVTDDRTRRGLTWGIVGGVVIGALFPPSILASAAVVGAAGAGIGRLRHLHHRSELAEELSGAIAPGHSGLVLLVSDPAVIEIEKALAKANRVVRKAVDKAVADDIKAEAEAADKAAAEGR